MARKTPTMLLLEERRGEPIETMIHRLYHANGLTMAETAKELGIVESALCRWMERLGIPSRRTERNGASSH